MARIALRFAREVPDEHPIRPATVMTAGRTVNSRPSAAERLRTPEGLLTRSDLRELGLERRAVDAVFRECPVIVLPGYTRPLVRVSDYLALLEGSTYCDRCGNRVRPARVG
jgi:hypothetical protein